MRAAQLAGLLAFTAGLLFTAPAVRAQGAAPATTPVATQTTPNPILRPGDAVQVLVWRNAEMSGEFAVTSEGRLLHPFLGTVVVGGLPFLSVRERLRSIIEAQVQAGALFTIQPLLRVALEGEVRSPNLYRHAPEVTIAEALAIAGGTTERGKISSIRLIRDGIEYKFDMRDPKSEAMWRTIQSGDRIIVDRRSPFSWRVVLAIVTTAVGILAAVANYFLFRARFE